MALHCTRLVFFVWLAIHIYTMLYQYTVGCHHNAFQHDMIFHTALLWPCWLKQNIKQSLKSQTPHYNDVIMGLRASQITSLTIVYSMVYSVADQRRHQSSASLAFVPGIHRWPVNSPHKWPVKQKMFPFDDIIMPNLTLPNELCGV